MHGALLLAAILCSSASALLQPAAVHHAGPLVSAARRPAMVALPLESRPMPNLDEYDASASDEDIKKQIGLPMLSGLRGKAMFSKKSDMPTKGDIRKAVPAHCYKKDTMRSLKYTAISVAEGAACFALGLLIPMKAAFLPVWLAYAAITGCVWTGMWVIAHECGHQAFSDNRFIQDLVGYILHTALLVPYFSWQHSHAVHHAHTNHITKGETHVPYVVDAVPGKELVGGEKMMTAGRLLGKKINGAIQCFFHLVFGWPAYLLFGATGGPAYGVSNHFIPKWPFNKALWPGRWAKKVIHSDFGIVAMLGMLGLWAAKFGLMSVMALYVGPLMFTNMWLVGYTWLQHTDVDVPHFTANEFSYMRGAMTTIDRPYGKLLDHLHHKIGSTHVAHHIDCTIPHYHAREATDAIAKNWPDLYLFDPTPIHKALWRISANCVAVKLRPETGRYTWVPFDHESELQYQGTAA